MTEARFYIHYSLRSLHLSSTWRGSAKRLGNFLHLNYMIEESEGMALGNQLSASDIFLISHGL
jgi:hypothetical protein